MDKWIFCMRFRALPTLLCAVSAVQSANWAQLAGERVQNTATPYIPDQWQRNQATSIRPMWSARWGHAVVVLNQSVARSYLTDEENSARARGSNPVLVLLGGDDGLPIGTKNVTSTSELGIGSGKLRNDVWVGKLASGSQSSWEVDDRYFVDGGMFAPNLIRSRMQWTEINPGRTAPPTWPSGRKYSTPLTNDEWIACQDAIRHKLVNPWICNDPPIFCYDDIRITGCKAQAVWKSDNMWSPRRGFGAAVVNGKIFVVGGRAREYARIDDSRLVGDIAGRGRVETMRDHSTVREDMMLKNDVWSSEDEGRTWTLVNPGCRDHQQDVLMKTEVWSRNGSDPSFRKNVGSIGSKCYLSSDCYGIAECRVMGNTYDRVCVCPMFSPREHHTLSVQRRFSLKDDGSLFEEDVMYVVGGFTSVKQSFCADRACGPADGYNVAMGDVWMSTDGVTWVQVKSAFGNETKFVGRGSHTALVVPATFGNNTLHTRDRLLIFGGETAHPQELWTTYLNDVWELSLPNKPCASDYECVPRMTDFNVVTSNAEWPERSGHTAIYEPPSSSNSFQPRIYLTGGRNSRTVFSDVWSWHLGFQSEKWYCDFCPESRSLGANSSENGDETSSLGSYLSINSPISTLQNFELPRLDLHGNLYNFSFHSVSPVMTSKDVSRMESAQVSTINDLVTADLYTILKLRGFDYPGRVAIEVKDICLIREISLALVDKCTLKQSPESYFHVHANTLMMQPSVAVSCGRGGDSKPCVEGDWDGCTPIEDVSVVDVHGLGNVRVPPIRHNVSSIVDELFCRQVPGSRALGAAAFIGNKFIVLGGINANTKHIYRDVWARDDISPRSIITTKPTTKTPQSTFSFDSNEDGAHVFEYKILHDGVDVTRWTTTTKSIGADVSWFDDKRGGPGEGWYTLYVRAVDPGGNRDNAFSTRTNVYQWYYVPPVPWGAVAGGVITSLICIIGGYFEFRRRKRKKALQRFAIRRLRRRFKLKSEPIEIKNSSARPRRSAEMNGAPDSDNEALRYQRSAQRAGQHESLRRRHEGRHQSDRSHSRSHRSRSNSKHHGLDSRAKHRDRRRRTKEKAADDERRKRRRQNREKNRLKNLRDLEQ